MKRMQIRNPIRDQPDERVMGERSSSPCDPLSLTLSPTGERGQILGGWTLIEMIVAHGLLAVVMTVSATLFVALARSERNAWTSCADLQRLSRLDEQFRLDVHRAASATIAETPNAPPELVLADAGGEVARYRVVGHQLERKADGQTGGRRETWKIAEAEWSFRVDDPMPKTVSLRWKRPAGSVTQSPVAFLPKAEAEIVAVLNLRQPETGGSP